MSKIIVKSNMAVCILAGFLIVLPSGISQLMLRAAQNPRQSDVRPLPVMNEAVTKVLKATRTLVLNPEDYLLPGSLMFTVGDSLVNGIPAPIPVGCFVVVDPAKIDKTTQRYLSSFGETTPASDSNCRYSTGTLTVNRTTVKTVTCWNSKINEDPIFQAIGKVRLVNTESKHDGFHLHRYFYLPSENLYCCFTLGIIPGKRVRANGNQYYEDILTSYTRALVMTLDEGNGHKQ